MADAGQFAQDVDILKRAGTKVSATVKAADWFDEIIVSVEATINCVTRFDWTAADTATTLSASVRGILIEAGACLAAIEGIIWDMSGFTSRVEAEDMINVLRDRALFALSLLADQEVKTFMVQA